MNEPDLILTNGLGLTFMVDAECPNCTQSFGECRCGFLNDMTLDDLVVAGFAKYTTGD
jgi:hypothetical protein